jgi:membrane associated rhomboid family serine protease
MIPLYDNVPTRRFPVVTWSIIAVNVVFFIFELVLPINDIGLESFIYRTGVTPYELRHLVDVPPPDLVPFWLTPFTSLFVHGGFLHIIFNMLFFWIFGNNVEDAMGRLKFLAFYLACGLAADLSQAVINLDGRVPTIGASGAIAGVMGAYIVLYPRAKVLSVLPIFVFIQFIWVPAWVLLLIWFVLQLISGLDALGGQAVDVAYFAHIGGFTAGLALVFLFVPAARRRRGGAAPDDLYEEADLLAPFAPSRSRSSPPGS